MEESAPYRGHNLLHCSTYINVNNDSSSSSSSNNNNNNNNNKNKNKKQHNKKKKRNNKKKKHNNNKTKGTDMTVGRKTPRGTRGTGGTSLGPASLQNPRGISWSFGGFFLGVPFMKKWIPLPETNSEFTPENGWLEYILLSYWGGLFSGANC